MEYLKCLLLVVAIWSVSNSGFAQDWVQLTNAPSHNWSSIACSADGSKLVAVNDDSYSFGGNFTFVGSIFWSTNSGANWTQASDAPPAGWIAVVSSTDGNTLIALPADGPLYKSIDSGKTWSPTNTPSTLLNCIALSADGTKVVAGAWDDFTYAHSLLYTSTNSCASWNTNNSPAQYWTSIASSANGARFVAVAVNPTATGPICTSFNSGRSWQVTSAPQDNWYAVASSSDGVKLIAAVSGGQVYTSKDAGTNWTPTILPSAAWDSMASSADGTKLIAAQNYGGTIYTSTNSGVDWKQANVPSASWLSVVSSADGNKLAAVSFQGLIYVSQSRPSPHLSVNRLPGKLDFSWVIPSTNFILQQSHDLISWVHLTNAPMLNLTNLQNHVTVSPTNSNGFFRLSSP
jgi:hypothetical protein